MWPHWEYEQIKRSSDTESQGPDMRFSYGFGQDYRLWVYYCLQSL